MAYQNVRITSIPAPLPKDYDRTELYEVSGRVNIDELNTEFSLIEEAVDETQARLRLIQRDDGALANKSVSFDTLADDLLVFFTNNPYLYGDIVETSTGVQTLAVAVDERVVYTPTKTDFKELNAAVGQFIYMAGVANSDDYLSGFYEIREGASNPIPDDFNDIDLDNGNQAHRVTTFTDSNAVNVLIDTKITAGIAGGGVIDNAIDSVIATGISGGGVIDNAIDSVINTGIGGGGVINVAIDDVIATEVMDGGVIDNAIDTLLLGYTPKTAHGIFSWNSGGDLNTATVAGIYRLGPGVLHTNAPPSNFSYSQMLVLRASLDTITQIISYYADPEYLWIRSGNPSDVGGTGSWSSWRRVIVEDVYGDIYPTGSIVIAPGKVLQHNNTSSYDKIRVWNNNSYTIGMAAGLTYGWINNDYAMTFTMNNSATRGFIWRDYDDAASDAAMSLTTDGNLNVKNKIGFNGGTDAYLARNANYIEWQNVNGYVYIGPANTTYCHFQTDRSKYYFNKPLDVVTSISVYGTNTYIDGSYLYGQGKQALRWDDPWLRLNPNGDFASGVYCGTRILRTDGEFQIGTSGASAKITSAGTMTLAGSLSAASAISSSARFFTGYDSGVANSVNCSNWFRSNGNTGWYNATYAGGVYMSDADWVRIYNSKKLRVTSIAVDSIYTDGGVKADGDATVGGDVTVGGDLVVSGTVTGSVAGAFTAGDAQTLSSINVVNNSTTLTDSGLSFTITAGAGAGVYAVEGWLRVAMNASAGLKVALSNISTYSDGRIDYYSNINTSSTPTIKYDIQTNAIGDSATFSPGDTGVEIRFTGYLYLNSAVSRTTTVQLAQQTAHGSNVVMYRGSWVKVSKVA